MTGTADADTTSTVCDGVTRPCKQMGHSAVYIVLGHDSGTRTFCHVLLHARQHAAAWLVTSSVGRCLGIAAAQCGRRTAPMPEKCCLSDFEFAHTACVKASSSSAARACKQHQHEHSTDNGCHCPPCAQGCASCHGELHAASAS